MLMKSVPDVVLHKVPDELGDIGRGIYKYKVVDGAFVLKDDLSDWEDKNKRAVILTEFISGDRYVATYMHAAYLCMLLAS